MISPHAASLIDGFVNIINNLPTELLGEIFHHYLHSDTRPHDVLKPRVTAFRGTEATPVLLTHVCGEWKRVAESTPALWSSIAIYNARWNTVPLIRLWLKRAGTYPLSIFMGNSGNEERQSVAIILKMLVERCYWWKSIDLTVQDFQPALMAIPDDSLETLVHASVRTKSWPTIYSNKLWKIIHSFSHHLESVHYSSEVPSHTPWSQLKVIHCSYSHISKRQLLESLKYCQNLEVLLLPRGYDGAGDPVEPPAEPKVMLPKLKELEVTHHDDRVCIIFDDLIAPQLMSLKIYYMNNRIANNLVHLKKFAARSGFMIQSFRIISTSLKADDLLEWLGAPFLSTVTELDIFLGSWHGFKDIIEPSFPDIHTSYMESVIARLESSLSRPTAGLDRI